jgi:hypothetical protein
MQTHSSLIDKSRDKNINFSTCMHLAPYTASVYVGSPLQPVYIGICARKSKLNVGFPCHDRRSLILGLPYTGSVLTRPFSCILKAIKKPILSYGKEREFNFESKVTLEKLLLHIEYASLCPLSLNTMFSPQDLPLLMENLIVSLL